MFTLLNKIISALSFEFLLTRFNWPNGGTIIFLRTLFISLLLIAVYGALVQWLGPDEGNNSVNEITRRLEIYAAVFAAIYLALYSRFSAQWTYLANLYNQIKQAESAEGSNPTIIGQWKAGFIEDAVALHLAKKPMFAMIINSWGEDEKVKTCFEAEVHNGKEVYKKLMEEIKQVLELTDTTKKGAKNKIIRTIVILVTLAGYVLSYALLYEKFEFYYFYSDVIWHIQTIQFYMLLSASLFFLLNIMLKIEGIVKHENSQLLKRNLTGLYGYLCGTGIYIAISLFSFEFSFRVYGLLIPFGTTLFGFLFPKIELSKKILTKKLLLTLNMIILFYWSVVLLEFHQMLEARNKLFGDDLTYFEKVEKKFLNKADSLSYALSDHLRANKSAHGTHSSNAKIDSLAETIIDAEFKLHHEYRDYSYRHDFFHANNGFPFWTNEVFQRLIVIGFILIVALNGLYLIYFHRDYQQ